MQTENDTSKPEDSYQQEAGEGCSGATCSRQMIYPGLNDRRLKRSWQGDVVNITGKKTVVIATVNARTLKEMRALKHHLVEVIRSFYANAVGQPPATGGATSNLNQP